MTRPAPSVEAMVQRGLTKLKTAQRREGFKARAFGAVQVFMESIPAAHHAEAGAILRDAAIARSALLTDPLTEACAIQAISRRMCPDAACPDARAAGEALFRPKRRAA